jgi:hypothetical protein
MYKALLLTLFWALTATPAFALDLTAAIAACKSVKNVGTKAECLAYVQNDLSNCSRAYNDKFCKQAMDEIRAKDYTRCDHLSQYATSDDDKGEMERWCIALTRRNDLKCREVLPDDLAAKRDCELTVKALTAMDLAIQLAATIPEDAEVNGTIQEDDVKVAPPPIRQPTPDDEQEDEEEDDEQPASLYEDIDSDPLPWRREVRQTAKQVHDLVAGRIKPMKGVDRSTYTDMALGFTGTREQQIPLDLDQDLQAALKVARQQKDQALVDQLLELIAEVNDRDNTNLRLFGDTLQASSWMDWAEVDDDIAADYSQWFETSAVRSLQRTGGKFKFNLTGFEKQVMAELKQLAATVPMELLNRAVNLVGGSGTVGGVEIRKIAKTEWEVIRILTDNTLFAATEWYAFDKLKDDAPVKLTGGDLVAWSVNAPVVSPNYQDWLAAKGAVDPLPEVEARMLRETGAPDLSDVAFTAWRANVTKIAKAWLGDADGLWDRSDADNAVRGWRRLHPPVVAQQGGPAFDPTDKSTWLEEAKREAVILHGAIDWTSQQGRIVIENLTENQGFTDSWAEYKGRWIPDAVNSVRW